MEKHETGCPWCGHGAFTVYHVATREAALSDNDPSVLVESAPVTVTDLPILDVWCADCGEDVPQSHFTRIEEA